MWFILHRIDERANRFPKIVPKSYFCEHDLNTMMMNGSILPVPSALSFFCDGMDAVVAKYWKVPNLKLRIELALHEATITFVESDVAVAFVRFSIFSFLVYHTVEQTEIRTVSMTLGRTWQEHNTMHTRAVRTVATWNMWFVDMRIAYRPAKTFMEEADMHFNAAGMFTL
ncbi:MAG: hypothetical protein AAFO91_02880 [Bacteroidota bacterium]